MDYSQRYFYLTRNFVPDYAQEFTHIQDDIYQHNRTGDLYRRRLLCDFGWGHEPGYERLPALSFDELISLIEYDPFPGKLPKLRRFLFSKKAYEIEYHVDAYMCMKGYSGYSRNITTYLFKKQYLLDHCNVINISTNDTDNFKQAVMFGYKNGIRSQYIGTSKDPYTVFRIHFAIM